MEYTAFAFDFPTQVSLEWHFSNFFPTHAFEDPSTENVPPASGPDQHSPVNNASTSQLAIVTNIYCKIFLPHNLFY